MSDVTVVIPVERGRKWNVERATHLPYGTPYVVAEHDPGEWATGITEGVNAVKTKYAILSGPDVWFNRSPEAVDFLVDLCEDVDVTWGPLVVHKDEKPIGVANEGVFCPNRLRNENYINAVSCVRKETFQKVGGVKTGIWDLYVRMYDAGAKFKYVPEAMSAREGQWDDPSDTPTPVDVKASFYHQATLGTAYWRCTLPARYLPAQVLFSVPARAEKDGKLVLSNHKGTAVFQYTGDQNHLLLTKYMQEEGTRVLVEVDDDYAHWSKGVMTNAGWHHKMSDPPFKLSTGGMSPGGMRGYSVECHRENAKVADGITVTTKYLAKMYRDLNKNVYVCPNNIDPVDWPELKKPDDGIFRIGWFASGSHRGDGQLIVRAMDWASRQKDVEIVLIGLGATNGKPWYKFPYKHYAWSNDLNVYKRFLLDIDLGLSPVTGNPWALCRSDLKALEYGMAGAYPIVSDQPPYDTVDVPKAKTPKDFLKLVQHAVKNRDETRQLAKEWREYVLTHRTVEGNIDRWREAIQE